MKLKSSLSLLISLMILLSCNEKKEVIPTNTPTDTPATQAAPSTTSHYQPIDWEHYNNNPNFKPATLPNGSVGNPLAVMSNMKTSRAVLPEDVLEVMDKVWVISGVFYAPVIIETTNGLIICPSGEYNEEGERFRRLIREKISKKPIIAVLYDHAHYPKGTDGLLDGDKAMIVAHPDHVQVMKSSGALSNPFIEELLPTLDAKARIHFSTDHPKKGADAPLVGGGTLNLHQESGWIAPTKTLKDGETITIDGVKIQGFHAVTDTEESLTFWLPEKKLIIDNVMWTMIPNLYTLRGDRYRSPQLWMEAISDIRNLSPEHLISVGGGGLPLHGTETIQKACDALYDAIAFIYDQSLRFTNKGVAPDELRHCIQFPKSLATHPYVNEVYGEINTFYEAFPTYNGGWFSGYAEDIHSLPNKVEAQKYVDLIGGETKVYQAFEKAMKDSEYLWAKELIIKLFYLDRANEKYRQSLADVFRALGQRSPSLIVRNFYTASAMSLEGNDKFSLNSIQSEDWVVSDLKRAINHLRVRINPDLANGTNKVLSFKIGDTHSALHIRHAIAEYIAEPTEHYQKADATIEATAKEFSDYFRGTITKTEFISKAKASEEAARLLGYFDEYVPKGLYPKEDFYD